MHPSASFAGLSRLSGSSTPYSTRPPMMSISAALKAAGSAQPAAGSASATPAAAAAAAAAVASAPATAQPSPALAASVAVPSPSPAPPPPPLLAKSSSVMSSSSRGSGSGAADGKPQRRPTVSSVHSVLLSKTNPLVGLFHHAPVAGNWVSALGMESQIVAMPTVWEQQAFRRNPYTGCMAPTGQQLKRLHELRKEMEAEQHARFTASRPSRATAKRMHVLPTHSSDPSSFGIAPYSIEMTDVYELGDMVGAGAFGQVFLARAVSDHPADEDIASAYTAEELEAFAKPRGVPRNSSTFSLASTDGSGPTRNTSAVSLASADGSEPEVPKPQDPPRNVSQSSLASTDSKDSGPSYDVMESTERDLEGLMLLMPLATRQPTPIVNADHVSASLAAALPVQKDYDFVVKVVKKKTLRTPELVQALVREAEIHSRLVHRNIVRLVDLFETADLVYFVMERVRGKDLGTYLATKRRLSEVEAAVLLKQLLSAVEYLHSLDVVHCDIKPANILLADTKRGQGATFGKYKTVRLCDFGTAKQSTDPRYFAQTGSVSLVPCKSMVGTSGYAAPEVLQHRPYGCNADVWSVGVIMYQMLAGFDPFFPYSACLKEPVPFPARPWASISHEAVDLVSAMLTVNPTERITAQAALLHPWFRRA